MHDDRRLWRYTLGEALIVSRHNAFMLTSTNRCIGFTRANVHSVCSLTWTHSMTGVFVQAWLAKLCTSESSLGQATYLTERRRNKTNFGRRYDSSWTNHSNATRHLRGVNQWGRWGRFLFDLGRDDNRSTNYSSHRITSRTILTWHSL